MSNLNRFLAKRFYAASAMSPSLRIMRRVTITGIVIGVATLLVALAVANGFGKAYQQSILGFNAHVVLVHSGSHGGGKAIPEGFEQHPLQGVHVKGITPFLYREGLAIGNGNIQGVIVKGIDPGTFSTVNQVKFILPEVSPLATALLPNKQEACPVILGAALARSLGVAQGTGTTTLMIPPKRSVPLRIVGTFESGLYDYDSQFALMNLSQVRALFHTASDELSGWELALDDPSTAATAIAQIQAWLPSSFQAISWQELNSDLFEALQLEKIAFSVIMGALVMVASLNVIGVLVLVILFRRREIALLQALGLARRQLIALFVREGMRVGMVGVLGGLILGLGIAIAIGRYPVIMLDPEIYFLSRLPLDISALLCGIITTFCMSLCWLTSFFAAWRLSSFPTVVGLRQAR